MNVQPILTTSVDTVATAGILLNAPGVDLNTAKATILALATSVTVQLILKGLNWISAKISKKKDDNDKNDFQPETV